MTAAAHDDHDDNDGDWNKMWWLLLWDVCAIRLPVLFLATVAFLWHLVQPLPQHHQQRPWFRAPSSPYFTASAATTTTSLWQGLQLWSMLWLTMVLSSSSSSSTSASTNSAGPVWIILTTHHISLYAHGIFLAAMASAMASHYFSLHLSKASSARTLTAAASWTSPGGDGPTNHTNNNKNGFLHPPTPSPHWWHSTSCWSNHSSYNNLKPLSSTTTRLGGRNRWSFGAFMMVGTLLGPLSMAVPSCWMALVVETVLVLVVVVARGGAQYDLRDDHDENDTNTAPEGILATIAVTSWTVAATTFGLLAWREWQDQRQAVRQFQFQQQQQQEHDNADNGNPVIYSNATRSCTNFVHSVLHSTTSTSTATSASHTTNTNSSSSSRPEQHFIDHNHKNHKNMNQLDDSSFLWNDSCVSSRYHDTNDKESYHQHLAQWYTWSPAESVEWLYQQAYHNNHNHNGDHGMATSSPPPPPPLSSWFVVFSTLEGEQVTCRQLYTSPAWELKLATGLPYGQIWTLQSWIQTHLQNPFPITPPHRNNSNREYDDDGRDQHTSRPPYPYVQSQSQPQPHQYNNPHNNNNNNRHHPHHPSWLDPKDQQFDSNHNHHPPQLGPFQDENNKGSSPENGEQKDGFYYDKVNQLMQDRFGMELPELRHGNEGGTTPSLSSPPPPPPPRMGAPRRPDDILDDVDDDEAQMQRNSPSTGLPAHLLPPDFLADLPPYIAQIVQQKPHLVEQILASHQQNQNQKQKQASGIMELPYSDLPPPPPPPLPPPPHVAMQSPKDDDDDNNGSGSGGSGESDKMGTGLGTDLLFRVARSHSTRTRKNGDDCYEDYGEEERSDGETTELLRHCRRRPRSTTVPPTASRTSNTTATTTTTTTTSAPSSASKLLLPGGDKMFYKSTV